MVTTDDDTNNLNHLLRRNRQIHLILFIFYSSFLLISSYWPLWVITLFGEHFTELVSAIPPLIFISLILFKVLIHYRCGITMLKNASSLRRTALDFLIYLFLGLLVFFIGLVLMYDLNTEIPLLLFCLLLFVKVFIKSS